MKKIVLSLATCSLILATSVCSASNKTMGKAQYSGKDLSKTVSISRNKDTKDAVLNIKTDGRWTIYSGNSVENIDFSKSLLEGEGSGSFSLAVNDTARSYFQVITDEGKIIVAEEHLPMSGGYNFRDLGGIKTKDNKYVKWGKILRSDDLHNLTDADLNYLSSIPLISIVDFRSIEEINQASDRIPSSVKEDYQYSITPGDLQSMVGDKNVTEKQLINAMVDVNKLLVTDGMSIEQYKKMFALLQSDDDIPLMFHCSAGKDRTGMGAALILLALGVDENIVLNNYLESNTYLAGKYSNYMAQKPELEPLLIVKPEYLKAGLEQIKKDYGTIENYLTKVLNVDINKMREMYLYR